MCVHFDLSPNTVDAVPVSAGAGDTNLPPGSAGGNNGNSLSFINNNFGSNSGGSGSNTSATPGVTDDAFVDTSGRFWVVMLLEHILIFFKLYLSCAIPDVPEELLLKEMLDQ